MQRDFERGGLRGEFVSAGKSLNLARIRRPNRTALLGDKGVIL
ncbi:hypothetical protein CAMRE0001_2509 [Campylobacter rectus RM3267]|uniref:Uncharacterized protein n=1 Tax=Campylobacter rectus RM3267 TaxID=553218 RepID=B9D5E2_CAMRE|nr:hypothetical protein CAMRE0001_2509 [Campylobacter rectus RM3267]